MSLTLVCVCMSVFVSALPRFKSQSVELFGSVLLWGRILCIMTNTVLFANFSDYCSSGCQDPNKQITPKTNASTHSCRPRADYAISTVCVCLCMSVYMCMCESIWIECIHMYYMVQEHSLKIWMLPTQYHALLQLSINHPFGWIWYLQENCGIIKSLRKKTFLLQKNSIL